MLQDIDAGLDDLMKSPLGPSLKSARFWTRNYKTSSTSRSKISRYYTNYLANGSKRANQTIIQPLPRKMAELD